MVAHRSGRHPRDLRTRRRQLGSRQQHLARRRQLQCGGVRRRPRRRADHRGRRRPQCGGGGVHARPQRPRDGGSRTRQGTRRAGAAASRRRGAVANDAPGQRLSCRSPTGRRCTWPAPSCGRCTPRATPPDRCAGTRPTSAWCSAATPCSPAAPAPPGARTPTSRRSWSRSRERLGKLPGETVVHTGHGDSTTIGDELVHYEEWVARGH